MINVAFIRVPKCGTTSLALTLGVMHDAGIINLCSGTGLKTATVLEQHAHAHQYVTMIRDPLQQYLSYYHYLCKINADGKDISLGPQHIRTYMPLALSSPTQEDFLRDVPKNIMFRHFYSPLVKADFAYIGVVEQMARSNDLLQAIIGWRHVTNLDINVNPDKPIGQDYTTTYDPVLFAAQCAQDYTYYNAGLDRFNTLCTNHGV
jgi:hypothetical protein